IPPARNANYAWLQHMLARLSKVGRAGIVLANGSMTTQQSGEGDIRKAMIKDDVVECMVALPGQLFANTPIPACLWFMSKDKKAGKNGSRDRSGEILFIDCRKMGSEQLSRTQIAFTEEEIHTIAQTCHRWRETEFSDGEPYEDVLGFCYSAELEEVEKHGFVLTPGRYVGTVAEEEDDVTFGEKMAELTGQLYEQMAKAKKLDAVIRKNLDGLGYGG
ncbi:N-6 DNA methylase, partial [Thiolapillus sp.]